MATKDRTPERLLRAVETLETANGKLSAAVDGSTGATNGVVASLLEAIEAQLATASAKVTTLRDRQTAKAAKKS
ncbi:MAG: hypothetical protein ACYC5O_12055 [Anaerolineae bacterium]